MIKGKEEDMLNFTMGPVMCSQAICELGAEQIPYFRTPEFSAIELENEKLIKTFAGAEEPARAVFMTGSGTAAMEAAIMNVFTSQDKVIVINGGSFGQRFADLCSLHRIPFVEIKLRCGEALTEDMLRPLGEKGCTGFVVNVHETSTGIYYDMNMISEFCRKNNLLLLVDAISSFLADPFNMKKLDADVMLIASQKALACPPGISIIVLSAKAVQRVKKGTVGSLYFDLNCALENGERGQTPFTPAVGILLQINRRLCEIKAAGGVQSEIEKTKMLAMDFREKIKGLPLELASVSMSNGMTPLHPLNASAQEIASCLKDEYGIWVCPNGGELADRIFRVGHLGALTEDDNTVLANAFKDLLRRGIL